MLPIIVHLLPLLCLLYFGISSISNVRNRSDHILGALHWRWPSKWSTTLCNGTPKTNSLGVFPILSCTDEFIANSTIGSNSNQLEVGCSHNKHLNTYSNVQWVHSVYPSDWGQYADVSKILACRISHNADQKFNVKHWSQSCKTAIRTLNICTIASKNNLAHYAALNCPSPTKQGVKQIYFVNLSMQVKTALQSAKMGRLVMKSMDIHQTKRLE